MKLKGIHPLEQHVEKLVLGVFVLAALGMVAFQFLRDSSVKVNNKQTPIAGAYEEAIREAERLQGRIRSTDLPPNLPEVADDVAASLRDRLTDPVAPESPLASTLGFLSSGLDGEIVDGTDETAEYAPLVPPAPINPVARSFAGALDPVAVAANPELREFVPAEQPYDIRAVSVQATFPASEFVRWLDTDHDGEAGPQDAYPKFLWINRLAALDVQLERQELLPSGEYSDAVAVPPTPGLQQAAREALGAGAPTPAAYRSIVASAREQRDSIVRPAFLPMIAGEPWLPPGAQPVAVANPGQAANPDELARLRSILSDKQRDLQQVESELAKPQSAPAGGGDRKSSRAQSVNPGSGGGSNRERGPTPEERRREALTQRRDRLEADIRQIEQTIADMGGAAPAAEGPGPDLLATASPTLDSGEDVVFWAHDLTAAAGATYRYRVRLLTSNPLFGDKNFPDASPVVEGEFSEWSAPIEVAPQTMVFFTSAQGGIGDQGGPQNVGASAEVYHFFYGYWRRANVRLSPGDAIAAEVTAPEMPLFTVNGAAAEQSGTTPTQIPVSMEAFLVDVVEAAAEAGFGQRKTRWFVVYRDEEGRLVSRLPEEDRGSPARLRAEAAAAAGLSGQIRTPGTGGEGAPAPRERAPASSSPRTEPAGGGRVN